MLNEKFLDGTRDQEDGFEGQNSLIKIIFSIISLINIGYYKFFVIIELNHALPIFSSIFAGVILVEVP